MATPYPYWRLQSGEERQAAKAAFIAHVEKFPKPSRKEKPRWRSKIKK